MTNFEKKQPKRTFFQAGQKAWLLKVSFNANPYKDEPFRSQWAKGWKTAQRQFNDRRRK